MRPSLPEGFLRVPIAHRAFHDARAGRPENGLSAIRAAVDSGYGIEIDLQLSADGRALVFHDPELDRLTDRSGPVRAVSAGEAARIALKDSADTIPTLEDVLATVAGAVPLLVEIKDADGTLGPSDGRLEATTAAALRGYAGPVAVMSFNPHSVAEMARLAPDLPRGIVTRVFDPARWRMSPARCAAMADSPDFDAAGASFLSHVADDLTRPRVKDLRARGVPVLCWTIRSPKAEAEARRLSDNVTFEGYRADIPA